MFRASESGSRVRLVLDDHGRDGVGILCSGMAAAWKMALILEAWLGVAEGREKAEEGIRFLLLFEIERSGVCGDAIL